MDVAVFGLFFAFFIVFGIAQFVGMVLGLVDLLRREDPQVVGDSRVIWALIVIMVPLGWLAYFVAGRR